MKTIFIMFLAVWASAQTPNPDIAGLPENTWMVLHKDGIKFDGHTAYSGGSYDRKHHKFLIFGGGHWDGWKNDVLALDISTGTWKSMYPPTDKSAYSCSNVNTTTPGMLLAEKMPASRHTWDQIEYMDHIGKTIMYSGATYSSIWSCSGNTLPADTWLYDYSTNTWEYKNVARGEQPSGEGGAGAYDPIGKLYYGYMKDRYYYWNLSFYDAATDKWTKLPGRGPRGQSKSLVIDRKSQTLWIGDAQINSYDIKTNTWTAHSSIPSAAREEYPSYDEKWDDLIFYNTTGSVLSVYHTKTDTWETLKTNGPAPQDIARPYGRFFYNPVDNVHMFIVREQYAATTYVYRYKGATPLGAAKRAPKADNQLSISVFPNPVRSYTTISLRSKEATSKKAKINIYDVTGNLYFSASLLLGASGYTWTPAGLSNGVYIMKIQIDNKTFSKRILVQK